MGGQFIKMLKFGFWVVIAFAVPKMITESGHYLKNLEKLDQPQQNEEETAEQKIFLDYFNKKPTSEQSARASQNYPSKFNDSLNRQNDNLQRSNFSESIYRSPIMPIEKMIRFDHNPNWIINHWSRVDTIQTSSFLGYRVAAMTGTQKDDLAGVLTYYFDNRQMRQIAFVGKTGDYSKILTYLQRSFGMVRLEKESTANQFVYEATLREESLRKKTHQNNKSRLLIRPTQTFRAENPNNRFEIEFQLNSPN